MEIADLQTKIRDEEHLKLLVIFNIIYGVLKTIFTLLLSLYMFFVYILLRDPKFYSEYHNMENANLPNAEIMNIIMIIVTAIVVLGFLIGIATLISAQLMKRRKFRGFSIAVACLNCISFPFGTLLGIFTLIVLFRDSVKKLYQTVDPNVIP